MAFMHVKHNHNLWADWLGRVAAFLKHDIDIEEFAEIWPCNLTAPQEIGSIVLQRQEGAGGGNHKCAGAAIS